MKKELSVEQQEYLKRCGLFKRELARCTPDTRMYHDLDIYGEDAEDFLYVLIDDYQVDMSGFDFDTFFPPEFFGNNWFTVSFFSMVPFAHYIKRKRSTYQPLTLAMIEKLIQTKRWRSLTDE